MPKTKALLGCGLREGTERVRAQFRAPVQEGSPEEYGGKRIETGAQSIAQRAKQEAGAIGSRAMGRVRNAVREPQPKQDAPQEASAEDTPIKTKEAYARAHEAPAEARQKNSVHTPAAAPSAQSKQPASRTSAAPSAPSQASSAAGQKRIRVRERSAVKTAPMRAAKLSVKATGRTVKTANRTVKTTNRTVRTTAKVTQRTAQETARAAKASAKATVATVKAVARMSMAVIRALAAALKEAVAAIAAGGWVAVVVILALALVGAMLCTAFGVFASNEGEDHPMTAAILEIDMGFREEIDREIERLSAGDYDKVTVQYAGYSDGDADFTLRWNDAIAVYAVRATTDEVNPMEVVEVTPEKIGLLRDTFLAMNTVEYDTEVVETEGAGAQVGNGQTSQAEPYRELILTVTVRSMDANAGADLYGFTEDQREVLAAMLDPDMLPLYAKLTGVDLMGGFEGSITDFTANLPAGTMGSVIAEAALTRLGTPYATMDCSQLSQYAYAQAGIALPRTSVEQAKFCYNNGYAISQSQLQPGDLIFWSKTSCTCGRFSEIHHVGVYVGEGKIVDASSSKGYVVLRDLWSNAKWEIVLCGRPHVSF